MFNNWINVHDLQLACRQVGVVREALKRAFLSPQSRVRLEWDVQTRHVSSWWEIPRLQQRWAQLATGSTAADHVSYFHAKYLRGKAGLRGVALGCGSGGSVFQWAKTGSFSAIDAYDITESRIREAAEDAKLQGLDGSCRFHVGDAHALTLDADSVDCVLVDAALHHFSCLESTLERINRWLKPGGFFLINEYVGPARFQWTDRQLQAASGLLAMLPDDLRRLSNSQAVKQLVVCPIRLY
jgi:SAM-dependent methyltransferase